MIYKSLIKNKEFKVHGLMANYLSKCLIRLECMYMAEFIFVMILFSFEVVAY